MQWEGLIWLLLTWKVEERPWAKETEQFLKVKDKKIDYPSDLRKRTQPCPRLNFRPMRLLS